MKGEVPPQKTYSSDHTCILFKGNMSLFQTPPPQQQWLTCHGVLHENPSDLIQHVKETPIYYLYYITEPHILLRRLHMTEQLVSTYIPALSLALPVAGGAGIWMKSF